MTLPPLQGKHRHSWRRATKIRVLDAYVKSLFGALAGTMASGMILDFEFVKSDSEIYVLVWSPLTAIALICENMLVPFFLTRATSGMVLW